ncbi:hypothetical protein LXL04_016366 [Taraxacum kok-saghyz]
MSQRTGFEGEQGLRKNRREVEQRLRFSYEAVKYSNLTNAEFNSRGSHMGNSEGRAVAVDRLNCGGGAKCNDIRILLRIAYKFPQKHMSCLFFVEEKLPTVPTLISSGETSTNASHVGASFDQQSNVYKSRSFENSYIPENPRTPNPLTFSKNRLRGAKNRSNLRLFAYVQKKIRAYVHVLRFCFKNAQIPEMFLKFFYRSLYTTYLKGLSLQHDVVYGVFGARVDETLNVGRGPYTFKILSQISHWIGSFCPSPSKKPRFLQLCMYDTKNEVTNRLAFYNSEFEVSLSPHVF